MPISERILKRRVEFHETDRAGMVHFSNYFRYLDTAVAEFFRSLDLPGPFTRYWGGTEDDEMDWPYVSISCDFKKPVHFDDLLEIHLWVARIGTKSLTFGVSFRRADEEVVRGSTTIVCSQGLRGHPRTLAIPQEIRERICLPSWLPSPPA